MECFKCGAPHTKTILRDAISNEGIVKICKKCSIEESLPLLRVQSSGMKREVDEEKKSVYDRLKSISGVRFSKVAPKNIDLAKQEVSLREIVDRNFAENVPKTHGNREDMVNNFHWIIMRARRMKKVTHKQLAEAIAEPEKAVKAAERGVLPEKDYTLVKKLEDYLKINILVKEVQEKIKEIPTDGLKLTEETTKMLTIADLRDMKRKKEMLNSRTSAPKEIDEEEMNIDIYENDVEEIDKDIDFGEKDLTQDEVNDLIFGRKRKG